ncbi:MAG: ribonuclease HII [Nitrospirae bacterium]|nr:ribonuclease HII [Nitrospirota bacterium]
MEGTDFKSVPSRCVRIIPLHDPISRDGPGPSESGPIASQGPDRTRFERLGYARGFERIAGLDEAGRGPLAGPVVAAAVILPKSAVLPGLRDSKKLTALQREKFFEEIHRRALAIGVGIVGHETIDRINILKATILAMNRALENLTAPPDYLLIDALTLPNLRIPQKALIKGDDLSQTIAAASVVAKVTRDRLMAEYDRRYPQYHFRSHKGYGTAEHLRALERFGPCPIHRKTFRRVRPPSVNHEP